MSLFMRYKSRTKGTTCLMLIIDEGLSYTNWEALAFDDPVVIDNDTDKSKGKERRMNEEKARRWSTMEKL